MTYVVRFKVGLIEYDFASAQILSGSLSTAQPKRVERIVTPGTNGSLIRVRDSRREPLVILAVMASSPSFNRTENDTIVADLQGEIGDLSYRWDAVDIVTFPDAACMSIEVVPGGRLGALIGFGEVAGSTITTVYRLVFDTPTDPA